MKKNKPKKQSRRRKMRAIVEQLLGFDNFDFLEVLNAVFDARQPINRSDFPDDGTIRKHFYLSTAVSCKKRGPEPREWGEWVTSAVARIDQAAYSPKGFRRPDIRQSGICDQCGVELDGIAKSSICPVCGAKACLT